LTSVRVGGARIRVADVVAVARNGVRVQLDPDVRARIAAARAVVLRLAQGETPIYGVNSALGANTGQLFWTADEGDNWQQAASLFPPINSVSTALL